MENMLSALHCFTTHVVSDAAIIQITSVAGVVSLRVSWDIHLG